MPRFNSVMAGLLACFLFCFHLRRAAAGPCACRRHPEAAPVQGRGHGTHFGGCQSDGGGHTGGTAQRTGRPRLEGRHFFRYAHHPLTVSRVLCRRCYFAFVGHGTLDLTGGRAGGIRTHHYFVPNETLWTTTRYRGERPEGFVLVAAPAVCPAATDISGVHGQREYTPSLPAPMPPRGGGRSVGAGNPECREARQIVWRRGPVVVRR